MHVDQATEQWFHVIITNKVNKVAQKTLACDHSNDTDTVHYAVQGGSSFQVCG